MAADADDKSAISDLLKRVQILEDERAVRTAVDRYCMLTDHGSDEEWLDIWTEDGVVELILAEGFAEGNGGLRNSHGGERYEGGIRFSGREGLLGFRSGRNLTQAARPNRETKHCHVQIVCEMAGDSATVESYLIALSWEDGEILTYVLGRTHDTLVRCPDNRWRFSKRVAATAGARIHEKIGRDL